jgi:hypothetical protein
VFSVRARASAWTVVSLTIVACAFDSGGGHGGASAEIGEASSLEGEGDDAADDDDGDATGDDDGASDPDADDGNEVGSVDESGADDAPDGAALLEFMESPAYDFEDVPIGTPVAHVVTLHNAGGRQAEAIAAAISGPYGWTGGAWPGTGGNCLDTLAPDGFCQIDLSFTPALLGPAAGELAIDYDDGTGAAQAVLSLVGAATGSTDNLLENGDAEAQGAPPPSWTIASGPGWQTTPSMARTGARSIFGGTQDSGEVVLYQVVSIAEFAAALEEESLQISFRGWSRAWGSGDDPHRFRLEFLDASGTVLESFQSDSHSSTTWTEVADTRYPPADTRSVSVRLHCDHIAGQTCGGYFDDMSVVAEYP